MAIVLTLNMRDSFNRLTKKRVETTAATVADALSALSALATDLDAVTDLALESVELHERSTASTFAGETTSNIDVGATFKVKLGDGSYASHKIPGFPLSLVGAGGIIDVAASEVVAYFANFLTGAACRLSDGEYVAEVVWGELDK